jgi:hypothetical protein
LKVGEMLEGEIVRSQNGKLQIKLQIDQILSLQKANWQNESLKIN